MYHPAKVREVIETTDTRLFCVETWDDNVFTVKAGEAFDETVEVEDVILLDYYPDNDFDVPAPRQVVAAKLTGDQADRVWARYQDLKDNANMAQMQAGGMQGPNFDGGYIG